MESAADKDSLLKAASETLHMFVDHIEALQNENNNLKVELEAVKSASSNKVTIEKVASVEEDKVNSLVSTLINHSILPEEQRQKCAQAMMEDPNNILEIANTALKSSEAPIETGYGIKQSSVEGVDGKAEADKAWFETLSSMEANY